MVKNDATGDEQKDPYKKPLVARLQVYNVKANSIAFNSGMLPIQQKTIARLFYVSCFLTREFYTYSREES